MGAAQAAAAKIEAQLAAAEAGPDLDEAKIEELINKQIGETDFSAAVLAAVTGAFAAHDPMTPAELSRHQFYVAHALHSEAAMWQNVPRERVCQGLGVTVDEFESNNMRCYARYVAATAVMIADEVILYERARGAA
jgi:hypothetical protein